MRALWALVTRRIAGKIILPYLLIFFLVGVLAAYIAIDQVTTSLEQKYREELAAAGRSANEAMVLLEDRNLAILRQMLFTEGVDTAVAQHDADALQTILAPIATNGRISYVDVFDPEGIEFLALRASNLGEDARALVDESSGSWEPVRLARSGSTDDLGDKHAGFVDSPLGTLFVSAAPVWQNGRPVGVITVGIPIDEVTRRLSQEAGSKGITLYTTAGTPIASTIRASATTLVSALTLPDSQRRAALTATNVVVRRTTVADVLYIEALSVLAVRREPALLMGTGNVINIIEEQGKQTRLLMLALFAGVLLLVLAIGVAIARNINRPIFALMEATDKVRREELDFEVPVQSRDEHGVLSEAFNEMRGALQERVRSRSAIQRYMSPKLYELIQAGELKMGGESREITVIKSDIRNFTNLSERMDPEPLVEFLNRYFEYMVAPISKYEGEVDKYMGDSILAKFGATEWYPDHGRRAVLTMIEMIEACELLNVELRKEGIFPIHMGIGGNTGKAVVGNIGSILRMEYTIISDAVNTAQRIEELCKEVGWDLLISEQTYEQARDVVEVGAPWSIRLRGQSRDTQVFPVLGRSGEVPRSRRRSYESITAARSGSGGRRN